MDSCGYEEWRLGKGKGKWMEKQVEKWMGDGEVDGEVDGDGERMEMENGEMEKLQSGRRAAAAFPTVERSFFNPAFLGHSRLSTQSGSTFTSPRADRLSFCQRI